MVPHLHWCLVQRHDPDHPRLAGRLLPTQGLPHEPGRISSMGAFPEIAELALKPPTSIYFKIN